MLVLFLQALAVLHVAGLVGCVAMINMDRFDHIKRNVAVGMLVLFASGTGLIFLLEEIQPFIWESSKPKPVKKRKQGDGAIQQSGGPQAGKKKAEQGGGEEDVPVEDSSEEDAGEAGAAVSSRRPKDVLQDCEHCPEMVSLAGGVFNMGAMPDEEGAQSSEKPQLVGVKIPSFALGRFEVTREQYRAFSKATGHPLRGSCGNEEGGGTVSAAKPGFEVNGWHPMTCVTWSDARHYAAWLTKITGKSYRLPTAAEWEFAARSGNPYPYQNRSRTMSSGEARFAPTPATRGTTAAGSFAANSRGLFDMHGNAAEWVEDCWADTLQGTPMNGKPIVAVGCNRVTKGGGWHSGVEDVRFAARKAVSGGTVSNGIGFRVARDFD